MKTRTCRSATIFLFLCALFFYAQKGAAATTTSITPGNWNTPATWDNGVPGTGDDVVIAHAVILDVAATVSSLSIGTGGTLTGPNDLTVTNALTIVVGTLNTTGSVTAGTLDMNHGGATIGGVGATGTVTINGAASIGNGNLKGKTLLLNGASVKGNGQFSISHNGIFRVGSAGSLTLANTCTGCSDFTGDYNNPGTIDNQGSIIKNTSNGIGIYFNTFNNSGSIQINDGGIQLADRGGNFTAGSVSLSGSSTFLQLNGYNAASTYNFTGGTVSGVGKMTVGYLATANFSGPAGFSANLAIDPSGSGTLNDNTAGLSPASLTLDHGGIYQGPGSPNIAGDLTIGHGATFDPNGTATIGGILNIGEGNIGASTSSTTNNVTVNGATNFLAKVKTIYKKTLLCQGGVVADGGSTATTGVSISMVNCTLTIPSGQTFLCTATDPGDVGFGNATLSYVNTLNLNGSLSKTGSGTLTMKNVIFNNAGDMDFLAGISRFTGTNDIMYSGGGSINVASGATLYNLTGTTNVLNYTNGTFTNNGTVSNFDLNFSGSSQQTLAGNGVIRGLTLNNASGLHITGAQTFTYPGNCTFTNGKISLQNGDLTIPGNSNISGYGPTKYFATVGTGRLVIMPVSGTRVYPVGPNSSSYNPVTVAATVSSTFGVRAKVGLDVPTGGTGYVDRQWQVDDLTGGGQANLTFQWNSPADQQGDFTTMPCQVLHYNGGSWDVLGSGNASCSAGVCSRTQSGVTVFSPFAIASGIALPIELTGFRGEEDGPANHFSWETASESNTKTHFLQRSMDGTGGWSTVAERRGAGNATAPTFYGADDRLPPAEAYYRLFVEDLDGKGEASPIVFIKRKQVADGQFAAFPNPVEGGGFWLSIPQAAIGLPLSVSVLDLAGRLVFDKKTGLDASESPVYIEMGNRLPAGAYLLKVSSERTVQALPILVGR